MNKGINEIGEARLCVDCLVEMAPEYVMRCMGRQRKGTCDRCGREQPATMNYKYTMKGMAKERKGLPI